MSRQVTVGLVDFDGILQNLALMKLSAYFKLLGHNVVFNPGSPHGLDRTFVSLIFTKSRSKALAQYSHFPDVQFGGTGFSLDNTLPAEIEQMRPDYSLYTVDHIYKAICRRPGSRESVMAKAIEIYNSGLGFTARGCVRKCDWCAVPRKEGKLRQVAEIKDLINPRSRYLCLLDISFTADPLCLDKLSEIRERNLVVNITQGVDVRLVTPTVARALSQVKHWSSLHYAWDICEAEGAVFEGINILSEFIKKSAQMCFCLCGYRSFEEDMYRVKTLLGRGIRPYVQIYQSLDWAESTRSPYEETRLQHFTRWVNSPRTVCRKVPFHEYEGWVNAQGKLAGAVGARQMDLALA